MQVQKAVAVPLPHSKELEQDSLAELDELLYIFFSFGLYFLSLGLITELTEQTCSITGFNFNMKFYF